MAGTYWLTILPDTSKLKPAIQAAMRGEKVTADFGVDEAKARKAGRDAAATAQQEADKAKPKIKPTADVPGSRKAGQDAADEAGKPVEQKRPKVTPTPDLPGSRKAGEAAGNSAASGIGAALRKLGPLLGGLSILGGLKSSVSEGMNFTESLNVMQGVTAASGDQMARVSELAKQLGVDVSLAGVNANDAASALTELAKGGMSVDESMKSVRGTLALAGAAGIDAADAATIQSDALHTFRLNAEEAGRVADLLTNSANASTVEVPQMAQALAQAGSAAAGFGIGIEDTLTSLAMFANFGIKGSDAGTLMKASLLAITDGGKPATEAMNALGLELYDQTGKFKGYPEMLRQVAEASQRMSEEQFQGATAVLFGSDAMRGAMIAANGGADSFNKTADAVRNGAGAAAMAEARMQGLPGAWANFTNTLDGVKMSVYDMVKGPLEGLLNKLSALPSFIERNSGTFKLLAAAITTLVLPALTLWTIAQAKAIGSSIVSGIGSLIGSFGKLANILKLSTAAQWLFNAALTANPIGLIIAAVAALTAGLVWFFTKTELGQQIWQAFTEYLKGAWESLKTAFGAAWDFIGAIWDSMVAKAGEVWEGIKAKFTAVVDFVKGLPGQIASAARGMWDGISDAFKGMIDKLKGWWNGFASRLSFTSPEWLPGGPITFSLPTFAQGGRISGPGTGTSDSILGYPAMVRVSNGEFVVNAAATRKFLPLLNAINGGMPGLASGGLVSADQLVDFAKGVDGQPYKWGGVNWGDCSGAVSALANYATGRAPFGSRFATATMGSELAARGFTSGVGPPGSLSIGWYNGGPGGGHTAATLPDGTNFEMGGAAGEGQFGGSAVGASDGQFTSKMHLPPEWFTGLDGGAPTVGGSASASSSSGSSRAATSSELSSASGKVDTANKAVTQAQQRVDDRTFTRDQAQKRLDKARAEGRDSSDEEESLRRANRELDDATTNLAEKRDKAAAAEQEYTDLQANGKLDASASKADSGDAKKSGPNTGDLGKMFVGGLLESVGLDGSLFSNPLEWPSIKSLMAGVNFVGGLASIAGASPDGGTGGGFASGAADAVGLGGLLSAIPSATGLSGSPALAPGEFNPAVVGGTAASSAGGMSTFAPHNGTGAAPGPVDNSININGPIGMAPVDVQNKIRTEQNARTRTTVMR